MIIICHRGYWKSQDEKNTPVAFERAVAHGWGIETDIRDLNATLVVSHDCPGEGALRFSGFLERYKALVGGRAPLALNIKSDGLQMLVKRHLIDYEIKDYFLFDMSVPDTLGYLKHGLQVFVRQSEYEPVPVLYDNAAGVWMDCFESDWFDPLLVQSHLDNGKQVCVVSPELHGRAQWDMWQTLRMVTEREHGSLMLCTDFPEDARSFFDGH